MSAEWVTAISTAGTFVVIAASAVAALVQLRHMRTSNQLAVLNEIRHSMERPEFRRAFQFVTHELEAHTANPDCRKRLLEMSGPEAEMVRDVGNFFDGVAAQVVKHGMVDPELACDWWYSYVVRAWEALATFTASRRAMLGYDMWEDFEYLALLCKRFRARYPRGTYPHGEEHLALPEPWPEAVEKTLA
jgi:hypothetical protein